MSFLDNRTVTALDIKSEHVRSILKFCDRSRKRFIETVIYINFPEYYSDGTISEELSELIETYKKKYTRIHISKPIYLGWEKRDPIDDKTAILLNVKLGSGASAFVEYLIAKTIVPPAHDATVITPPTLTVNNSSNEKRPEKSSIQDNATYNPQDQISAESLAFMELTEGQFDDE